MSEVVRNTPKAEKAENGRAWTAVADVLARHRPEPCAHLSQALRAFWWSCEDEDCAWTSTPTPTRDEATHAALHRKHVAVLIVERLETEASSDV